MNPQAVSSAGNAILCPKIQSCLPKQDLKGRSVAIIGLGKSGISATKLALARGASVLAIDENEKLVPLGQNILSEKHSCLKTILGQFDHELLKEADVIVVSPGVPLKNYGLSLLLQSGKRVMSELDFAAEVLPSCTKVLAVTGTNGKSTVATFAGQILHQLNIETFVGGNLGIPLSEAAFQCITSCPERFLQVAVVEVSSYQLEIPYKFFHPSVAVILNLTPDHLERHKTMENYAMTKCRVFSHMTDKKIAILPLGNSYLNEAIAGHENECNFAWIGAHPGVKIDMEARIANFEVPTIEHVSQLPLSAMKTIGTQNYYNAAVAALSVIGLDLGINDAAIYSTIGNLRAPPHRMEVVHKDSHGITWVDDSKATNVDATYTGLMGLKELKAVVLLGGLAKASDVQGSNGFERLVKTLKYHRGVITVCCIPFCWILSSVIAYNLRIEFQLKTVFFEKFGSAGIMIQNTLSSNGLNIPCIRARDLKDAVRLAKSMAKTGDAIVLSPGCASFDEFRNFEHRGKFFQELAFSK